MMDKIAYCVAGVPVCVAKADGVRETIVAEERDRLVTFLLQQERTEEGLVDLFIPKQIIASRLSIKPETLSRILARLREKGLVDVTGDRVTLIDEAALRALLAH